MPGSVLEGIEEGNVIVGNGAGEEGVEGAKINEVVLDDDELLTVRVIGPISRRDGPAASGICVMVTVVTLVSGRFKTVTLPTEELKTAKVAMESVDTVMLVVELE